MYKYIRNKVFFFKQSQIHVIKKYGVTSDYHVVSYIGTILFMWSFFLFELVIGVARHVVILINK